MQLLVFSFKFGISREMPVRNVNFSLSPQSHAIIMMPAG
jgi:hypothetical protein